MSEHTKASSRIYQTLASMPCEKGIKPTHVSMDPKGSFYMEKESQQYFFEIYCEAVSLQSASTEKYESLCVSEYPQSPTPFRLDLDILSHLGEKDAHAQAEDLPHSYTDNMITKLIAICHKEISAFTSVSASKRCVVMEKPARIKKMLLNENSKDPKGKSRAQQYKKDGIHVHFTDLFMETWSFEGLKTKIQERAKKENLFPLSKGGFVVVDFDSNISSKAWLMYGSAKEKELVPFTVSRCFNENGNEVRIQEYFGKQYERLKASTKRKLQPLEYYLPRFLSIRDHPNTTKLLDSTVRRKKEISVRGKKVRGVRSEEEIMRDIKTIKDGGLMDMLSEERAENRDLWMEVGWSLFCIGEGCEEAMDLWIEFSQRSEKFIEGECEELWAKMEIKGKTIGSIFGMAIKDNPEAYYEWKNRLTSHRIEKFKYDRAEEGDVAELVVEIYKDRYICSNASKNIWYEFINHRWRRVDSAITLKKKIFQDIRNKFKRYLKTLEKQELEESDDDEQASTSKSKQKKEKNSDKHKKNILDIIRRLKQNKFLNAILEMCKMFMYDSTFFKKLDKNRFYIGCENGIIDLSVGDGIFREGRPDDYVSKSTGLYFKDYTGEEDDFLETEQLFHKTFPDPEKLQFIYDVWTMALQGRNSDKIFVVCTGPKHHGKSGIHDLFLTTLGDYGLKSPTEVIQKGNKISSASARPELERLDTARAQVFDEVSDVKTLDIDAIKRQTGNDSRQWCRGLYDNGGREITPMYVSFMQCNVPPKIPGDDDALWDRMKVIVMESYFPIDARLVPEAEEEQWEQLIFHRDPLFQEKLSMFAPVVLWKLFKNYPRFKRQGVVIPKVIVDDTASYRAENDIYDGFIKDTVRKGNDADGCSVMEAELYEEFKSWFKENYPSVRYIPDKKLFARTVSKKLGKMVKHKWNGYYIHSF